MYQSLLVWRVIPVDGAPLVVWQLLHPSDEYSALPLSIVFSGVLSSKTFLSKLYPMMSQ